MLPDSPRMCKLWNLKVHQDGLLVQGSAGQGRAVPDLQCGGLCVAACRQALRKRLPPPPKANTAAAAAAAAAAALAAADASSSAAAPGADGSSGGSSGSQYLSQADFVMQDELLKVRGAFGVLGAG